MKRRLTILALTALAVVALFSVVLTVTPLAHAGGPTRGATQISGTGVPASDSDCPPLPEAEVPEGTDDSIPPPAPLKFTGDLNGCFYSFPSEAALSPSGTYRERGIDIFVELDEDNEETGRFEMNYLFTAKFDEDFNEIWGRCQHPIIAGSGTGVFDGVTGRLDLKDDVVTGDPDATTFRYRGHLRYP